MTQSYTWSGPNVFGPDGRVLSPSQITDTLNRAGGRWQPIETAPRDGSRVLIYLRAPWSCVEAAHWCPEWGNWQTDRCFVGETDSEEAFGVGSSVPTHWMPLPSPPESEGAVA